MDEGEKNGEMEEEIPQIDPETLKPNLYQSAVANDTVAVLQFLEQGVPPTFAERRTGLTALHWAALNGNVILVKKLLEHGASEPYHAFKAKTKRDLKHKSNGGTNGRRRNKNNSNRLNISANSDNDLNNPQDESKDLDEEGNNLRVDGDEDDTGDHGNNNNNQNNDNNNDNDNNNNGEEDEEDNDTFEVILNDLTSDAHIDYARNTPLLYATQAGHARVIWLLLGDGYSCNDVDIMENNSIHLAAAYGDVKLLQVLINDGGNANAVNFYKNHPIDLAKNQMVRDLLVVAMEQGASLTEEDRQYKHEVNQRQYSRLTQQLIDTIAEATALQMQQAAQAAQAATQAKGSNAAAVGEGAPASAAATTSSTSSSSTSSRRVNKLLLEAIDMGKEQALDIELISAAELLLKKIEVQQDLIADISTLQRLAPIRSQTAYIEHVYQLEKSIERAVENQVEPLQVQVGLDLIARCQIEYWLSLLLDRLKEVTVANESNEHDMNKLRAALSKAQDQHADEAMILQAERFLGRLDSELGMYRALRAIPAIKLPLENPPEGYYNREIDIGHIKETEGYPLPPAENNGEYVWIASLALTRFQESIQRLKSVYSHAESYGGNPAIIAESKERLTKAEKELKLLEAKDSNDKLAAIEVAKKQAKKLKSKKGGGKKK